MNSKLKNIFLCIIVSVAGKHLLISQTTIQPRQMDYSFSGVLYTEEKSFTAGLHTSGLNLGYRKGNIRKYYLTNFFQFELSTLKHPKEYYQNLRTQSILHNISSSGGFVYGKQNSFFALRGGIGAKRYFSEKARRKGVAVALTYGGGMSLGVTKPYYLDIKTFDRDRYSLTPTRYDGKNAAQFLDIDNIASAASFFKGFNQLGIIPGFQGHTSANFSFGEQEQFVKAIEAGIKVDVFTRKVPIMILTPNTAIFINFYLGIEFGKRK